MRDIFKSNIFNKVIIIASILALFPFLLLCLFTQPTLDDFGYALNLSDKSFIETQINIYMNWSSRYTATGLLILNPIQWDSWNGYKLISLGMIVLFVIATFYMFYKITTNNTITIILGCSFIFCYLFMIPEIVSSFYWLAGSATYHLANILLIFFVGLSISYYNQKSLLKILMLFLLVFLIIGCNEISMIYLDICIFIIFIYSYFKKKKLNSNWLILLVWAGFLTLLILLSPGNAKRSSSIIHHIPLLESFFMAIKKSIVIIFRYGIIVFIINLLVFYNCRNDLKKYSFSILNFPFYFYIIALFIFLFLGSFPSLVSIGSYPPQRTVNVIFLPVLVFSMIISYKIVVSTNLYNLKISPNKLSFILLFIIFSYSFIVGNKEFLSVHNNLYLAYYDLISGNAYKYNKEIEARYKKIEYSNNETIVLSPLNYRPRSIFISDLSPDQSFFYNQSMAKFFSKKTISILEK
ncbi:hypothetical protein ETU10_04000 [Apibacter muscae]|nr:hypothetical protein ETU10_04000 [Apibacter muscae]